MSTEKSQPSRGAKFTRLFRGKCGAGWIGAALALLAGVIVLHQKFGLGLVHLSYDLPYAFRPQLQPREAVMVYLDEDSHRELNQPLNAPWNRALHAKLLDRLTAEGAKAVVFDIVFSGPSADVAADEALAKAIRANGHVVLAADCVITGYGRDGVAARQIDPPFEPLMDAAAAVGSAEMRPDDDLVQREHTGISQDDQISSMSWAAASVAGAAVTLNETNRLVPRWVNYYGPATTIPNVSFYQALATNSDLAPAGYFSNKVVFVGARLFTKFSGERKDEYPTPHSRWAKKYPFTAGAEIQATQFLNLQRADWLQRLTQNQETLVLMLAGVVFGFGLILLRPLAATGLALVCALGVALTAIYLFAHQRLWFPWLIVVALQLPIALLWSILYNSFNAYLQNRLLEQSLGLYLSPKQVQRILKEPGLRQPGGSKQVVSILFSDIAGFSRISEQLDPQELVQLLNAYYEQTIRCIHQTDGTIVDIIGDAIFAIWNAPELQPDHQEKMLAAALAFQKNVTQFNGKQGGLALNTRVGLHTGEVVVGNVGSTEHFDYTAIGENVNLASRLEGLNKQLGTNVLLTRAAIPSSGGQWLLRPVGKFQFKGFENFVEVIEFVVTNESPESVQLWLDSFAAALAAFGRKEFVAAEKGFQRTLELRADDGPSQFYLKQIAEVPTHPVPENWAGEISLKEK